MVYVWSSENGGLGQREDVRSESENSEPLGLSAQCEIVDVVKRFVRGLTRRK